MKPAFTEHARNRAIERYDAILTDADLCEIHAACFSGKAVMMQETGQGRIYIFTLRGTRFYPVISKDTKRLVTFAPRNYFAPGQRAEFACTKNGTIRKQAPSAPKVAPRRRERRNSSVRDWFDEAVKT